MPAAGTSLTLQTIIKNKAPAERNVYTTARSAGALVWSGICFLQTDRSAGVNIKWPEQIPHISDNLLPFNGSRRLGTYIVNHPVYALYVINDLIRDLGKQLVRKMAPIGRHPVYRTNRT